MEDFRRHLRARTKHVICVSGIVALILTFCTPPGATVGAQGGSAYVRLVRCLEMRELGLANPSGLAFSSEAKTLFVLGPETETPVPSATLLTMSHVGERVGVGSHIFADPQSPNDSRLERHVDPGLTCPRHFGAVPGWSRYLHPSGRDTSQGKRAIYSSRCAGLANGDGGRRQRKTLRRRNTSRQIKHGDGGRGCRGDGGRCSCGGRRGGGGR